MFYDVYLSLCKRNGKRPSAIAAELGINKSNVSNWKNNGYTPRGEVLQKLADYFNVSVDYLLGNEQKEAAHTNTGADGEDLYAAFFEGGENLTEEEKAELWQDAKDFVAFKIAQKKGKQ